MCVASRGADALGSEGTLAQCSAKVAKTEERNMNGPLPPAFAALNDARSLHLMKEICEYFGKVTWATCLSCWRAWYAPPADVSFSSAIMCANKVGGRWPPRFAPGSSSILKHFLLRKAIARTMLCKRRRMRCAMPRCGETYLWGYLLQR